jgi:hypothetical protein
MEYLLVTTEAHKNKVGVSISVGGLVLIDKLSL